MPLNLAGLLAGTFLDGGSGHHHTACSSTTSADGVGAFDMAGGAESSGVGHHSHLDHAWDSVAAAGAARTARKGRYMSFIDTSFAASAHQGIHFHAPIDSAFATSTYTSAVDSGGPSNIYGPARALAPGSGYWCSSGHHDKDDIVTWKGFLHKRRPVSGMKVSWAYAPGEIRVRTTPDSIHWDTAVKWHKPLKNEVSFEEDLIFDRPRNVMAVNVDMRKPKDWGYFGINQTTLVM